MVKGDIVVAEMIFVHVVIGDGIGGEGSKSGSQGVF